MPTKSEVQDVVVLSVVSIERLEPALRRFLRRRLGETDVDDVLQETFLDILKRETKSPILNLDRYAFSVATNAASRYFRRRAQQYEVEREFFRLYPNEYSITPDQVLSGGETMVYLMKAVDGLPERTRFIFRLNRCLDMSHPEISKELNISVSAVEKHVMKALRQLSSSMNDNPAGPFVEKWTVSR